MSKPLRSFRMAFTILQYLAIHPNETAYRIELDLKIDRPTIRAAVKLLVKANLLAVAGKPRKLATGLERKEYKVTPQGVVALLQAHPDQINLSRGYLRDLARNQADFLPLVFGKWDYFRERNVEDLAVESLLVAVARTQTENEVDRLEALATGKPMKPSLLTESCVHRHDIYEFMLCRAWNYVGSEKDWRLWLIMIKEDAQLLAMAERELDRMGVEVADDSQFLKVLRETLHSSAGTFRDDDLKPRLISFHEDDPRQEAFGWLLELVKYAQALALDERREPPSREYVFARTMERGLKGFRKLTTDERQRLFENLGRSNS